jgi:hypothetical protein
VLRALAGGRALVVSAIGLGPELVRRTIAEVPSTDELGVLVGRDLAGVILIEGQSGVLFGKVEIGRTPFPEAELTAVEIPGCEAYARFRTARAGSARRSRPTSPGSTAGSGRG